MGSNGGGRLTVKALNLGEVADAESLPGWPSDEVISGMLICVCGLAVSMYHLEDGVYPEVLVRIEVDALVAYHGLGKVLRVDVAAHGCWVWRRPELCVVIILGLVVENCSSLATIRRFFRQSVLTFGTRGSLTV